MTAHHFARLLSPPLADDIARTARMNRAYENMIEASLDRNDDAYERAKADFHACIKEGE